MEALIESLVKSAKLLFDPKILLSEKTSKTLNFTKNILMIVFYFFEIFFGK